MQNVQADNGPNHKGGDRPFKAGVTIPLHDFRRCFHQLMPAFLSSFEWRIANFMIPVAFIDYIQGYTSGELCKHSEENKIIQPLDPHSKLSPHLHSLGCSQSISTPYRDSPHVLFVPHCHSPSVSFTCTLHPHSYPLVFLHQFPALTFCWAYQLCSAYRAHCD